MRIIAGTRKGYKLFSVDGNTARPTTDFMREFIFSVIQDIDGYTILDLFAGTGSVGIEALSRGASYVDFVEFSSNSVSALVQNLKKTEYDKCSHIFRKTVSRFLQKCDKTYDLIFMDPPYNKGLVKETLDLIIEHNILRPNGLIIIDHYTKEKIPEEYQGMVFRDKRKKEVTISFLRLNEHEENDENL